MEKDSKKADVKKEDKINKTRGENISKKKRKEKIKNFKDGKDFFKI